MHRSSFRIFVLLSSAGSAGSPGGCLLPITDSASDTRLHADGKRGSNSKYQGGATGTAMSKSKVTGNLAPYTKYYGPPGVPTCIII